jgi:hypothetical protein
MRIAVTGRLREKRSIQREEIIIMDEEKEKLKMILENILQSARLVLEHYRARDFRNTLIEVGVKNVLGMAEAGLEVIEQNQAKKME